MDDKMVAASVSRVASAFLAASAAAECSQTLKGLAYIIATARKSSGSVKLDAALKSCLKEETFGDVLKGVLTAAGFDISGSNVGVDLSLDLSEYSDKTSLLAQRLCVRASEILQSAVGNAEVLNALSPEGLLSWSESDQDNFNRHCQFVSCASDLLAFERERGEGGDVWQEVEEMLQDGLGGLVSFSVEQVHEIGQAASAELDSGIVGVRKSLGRLGPAGDCLAKLLIPELYHLMSGVVVISTPQLGTEVGKDWGNLMPKVMGKEEATTTTTNNNNISNTTNNKSVRFSNSDGNAMATPDPLSRRKRKGSFTSFAVTPTPATTPVQLAGEKQEAKKSALWIEQSLGLTGIFAPLQNVENSSSSSSGVVVVNDWDEVEALTKSLERKFSLDSEAAEKRAISEEATNLLCGIAAFVDESLGQAEVKLVNDAYNKSLRVEGGDDRGEIHFTSLKDSVNGIRRDVLGRVARVVINKIRERKGVSSSIGGEEVNVLQPKTFNTLPAESHFQTPKLSNKTMAGAAEKGIVTHSAGPLKKRAKKRLTN
ncbi:hypothetical protein TrST_g6426 [Triparma strigata]|uniref:Uncharacterized protein n=1 Tax=Triparma strigata TaxID=1606541 RepID=A0A9W7BQP9_9STRA|nr:hypothetical protein TrST_g6426 [Triparma strigata]